MNNHCEVNDMQIAQLELRVKKLEDQRQNDYDKIVEHNTQLATIVVKLENVTKSMEVITENWKEVMNKTIKTHSEDRAYVEKRIDRLEGMVNSLSEKINTNKTDLENTIDERTIDKDYKTWNNVKWLVLSGIVSAILGFVISMVLK